MKSIFPDYLHLTINQMQCNLKKSSESVVSLHC